MEICKLEMGDPAVESILMHRIYARLPAELQMGFKSSNLEGTLQYVANFSKAHRNVADITNKLKQEAFTTAPGAMWRKFQVYLRDIRPTYTEEQVAEEAWSEVRDTIYENTPYQPHISGVVRPPDEKELKSTEAVWEHTMKNSKNRASNPDFAKSGNQLLDVNHVETPRDSKAEATQCEGTVNDQNYDSSMEAFRGGGTSRFACHNCGELGHFRRYCRHPNTGFHRRDEVFKPEICRSNGMYARNEQGNEWKFRNKESMYLHPRNYVANGNACLRGQGIFIRY